MKGYFCEKFYKTEFTIKFIIFYFFDTDQNQNAAIN